MSRKNTIIISVLVNAALLAVLFITAITSEKTLEEEMKSPSKSFLEETTIDAKQLFSSDVESKETVATKELIPKEVQKDFLSLVEEKEALKKDEEKVIYKLPQIEKNVEEKAIAKTEISNNIKIIIKKGDTLEKIAKANNVKIAEIVRLNNLPNSFLRIGQELLIPKKIDEKVSIVEAKPSINITPKNQPEYYTIKVGDNPYTIAIKHNIKLSDILKLNSLDEKKARKLKPGDKLRIR
jgi:LysM repeat protein